MLGLAFTLHLVLCAVASCISLVPNQGAGDQFQAVGHLFQGHTEGIRGFIYVIFQSWNQLEFFQVPCEYSNTAADKAFSSGLKSIRTFYIFISVFFIQSYLSLMCCQGGGNLPSGLQSQYCWHWESDMNDNIQDERQVTAVAELCFVSLDFWM